MTARTAGFPAFTYYRRMPSRGSTRRVSDLLVLPVFSLLLASMLAAPQSGTTLGVALAVIAVAALAPRQSRPIARALASIVRAYTLAQASRRGSFMPQSQPDAPGRPRPRAPGMVVHLA